ncbi:MAG: NAD-dependent deacetylase [Flavobacterium sp.]|jgi:NAD-dependent deacetylase
MRNLVILSGAGISAESGIKTFRDSDGLWEGHDVMAVATPEGFAQNPELVLNFYNQRRKQLKEVLPNLGHLILAELENFFNVQIITQNVDNLHEKAGSSKVLHLHGELTKVRSVANDLLITNCEDDINLGDFATDGNQLRPHIVWFGEEVPALEEALLLVQEADFLVIIGTSMQVYPAAGLVHYCPEQCKIFYIDPKPASIQNLKNSIEVIPMSATNGVKKLKEKLLKLK